MTTRVMTWNGRQYTTFVTSQVQQVRAWAKENPRLARGLKSMMTAYRGYYCSIHTLIKEANPDGKTTRFCFVWSGNRSFVGMCRTDPDMIRGTEMLLITAVVVAAAHRGRGVCALLMKLAKPSRDRRGMVLYVDKTNTTAIRCYTAAGFVTDNRVQEKHLGYMEMQQA